MYPINKLILVLTVCDLLLGLILGAAANHYYPEWTAWLFR